MKIALDARKVWTKKTDRTGRLSGLPANTEVVVIIEARERIPPQVHGEVAEEDAVDE